MDARPHRRRWWLAGFVLVLAASAVAFVLWPRPVADEPARAAARVGEALSTGRVPPGTFDAPDAEAQLAAARRGLGTLLPQVVVSRVVSDAGAGTGSAVLEQRWTIHAGKPVWSYRTTVALRRTPEGWRALWSPTLVHTELRAGDSLKASRLAAQRGEVIGAGDTRLVFRQAVNRVVVDLALTDRATAEASTRRAAEILDVTPDPLVARVAAAADTAAVEIATLRTLDAAQRADLAQVRSLPGVAVFFTERMLALTPTFARPFLGTVGTATADAIAASQGAVREGDQVGLSGLQAAQDRTLRGSTGFVVQRLGPEGGSELFRVAPLAGTSVRVALDGAVQQRADAAVAAASGSAVVVLRPGDGHVLAAASNADTSLATQGRLPLGPIPPGLPVDPLRWGTDGDLGVPAFLGETTDQAWASPLGLAQAAASAAAGETVVPVLVVTGEPARPALSAPQLSALEALVAQADALPEWAVRSADGVVVVAYGDDADELAGAVAPLP